MMRLQHGGDGYCLDDLGRLCGQTTTRTASAQDRARSGAGTEQHRRRRPRAEILAAQPAEVRAAVKEHEQKGKWPSYKTAAYVLYPYNEGAQPIVDCAPLRTTDLQLQAGETVTDLALGDQERWMATPASSGDPRNPVPHVALKPQAPGIETNLTIYTTRHIYHLILRSGATVDAGGRVLLSRRTAGGDERRGRGTRPRQSSSSARSQHRRDRRGRTRRQGRGGRSESSQLFLHVQRTERAVETGAGLRRRSHVFIQMATGMKHKRCTGAADRRWRRHPDGQLPGGDGDYYVVDRLVRQGDALVGRGPRAGPGDDRYAYSGEAR